MIERSRAEIIEVGDEVSVHWEHLASEHFLTVLQVPSVAGGQCWIFKSGSGSIIYVQQFSKMHLFKKGNIDAAVD